MNPWVVRSPCTPACATEATPRVTAARIAQRYIALSGALALGAAQQRRLADPHIMRIQARNVLRALGVRIDASRTPLSVPVEPGGPGTLIVADHISWLDVLALLAVEPATLLAKREVERWPVFGSLATKAGARFIDRDRPRELPTTVADLAHLLRAGRSVMVFPQGTTWCSQRAGGQERTGGGTDAAYAALSGKPVIESLGLPGFGYHSNQAEYVMVDAIPRRLYLASRLVMDLAQGR